MTSPLPHQPCEQSPTQGLFVSDLHLFTARSHGERLRDSLQRLMAERDLLVLGGDIFDFKWSQLESDEQTALSAAGWLGGLVRQAGSCRVHYLCGNHDTHPLFREQLARLSEAHHNFDWTDELLRIGDAVFLHGDVADGRMDSARLLRRRAAFSHRTPPKWRHRAYDVAIEANLHRACARMVYPHRVVLRRLRFYLNAEDQWRAAGVRRVYFGHTHRAMNGREYDGVRFFNGGAPIGRARFEMISFTC